MTTTHEIYSCGPGTVTDNQWHHVELDLRDAIDTASQTMLSFGYGAYDPDLHIDGEHGYYFYLDRMQFSAGRLEKSWQVVPGAALGGVLGAQTGAAGSVGSGTVQSPAVAPWGQYYYHYNDLGTVVASSKADGSMLGVYEPDFYGNYRFTHGARPDSMGLTGKLYDAATGLYWFGARWYDRERGNFISKTQYTANLEQAYTFSENNVVNRFDKDGRISTTGGTAEEQIGVNKGLAQVCATILATAEIPGVPKKVLQCMKDVCRGRKEMDIKIDGPLCNSRKAGYNHWWSNTIVICPWAIFDMYKSPPKGPKVIDTLLLNTIAHEMTHRCGSNTDRPGCPAEVAGNFAEDPGNWAFVGSPPSGGTIP